MMPLWFVGIAIICPIVIDYEAEQTLDRMTRSAGSRRFQIGRNLRAPRHRSALCWSA